MKNILATGASQGLGASIAEAPAAECVRTLISGGISNPVIVDLLDGSVYSHEDVLRAGEYVSTLRNMPIRDYPLLLTDAAALDGRIETP